MGPQRDVKTSLTLLEATKKRDHKRSQDGIPQGTLSGAIKRRKSGVVIGGTSPVAKMHPMCCNLGNAGLDQVGPNLSFLRAQKWARQP